MRARIVLFVGLIAALAGLVALFGAALAAGEADKGVVASLISKALSSPNSTVSIGSVDGALSSDVAIGDVVVADADGPWLKLDKAHLAWNRLALFQRKLDVQTLAIGRLEILRRPRPAVKRQASEGPLLPELPLKVVIQDFSAKTIALGAPLIGQAAEFSAKGSATLGPPSEGLNLVFSAKRSDAPGAFDLGLSFVPQTTKLTLHAKFDEPPGGLVARALALPGAPKVDLALDGEGPLDAFAAKLALSAGADIGADGKLTLARQGTGRRLAAALDARVAGLLPPIAAEVFAGDTALDASIGIGDDGSLSVDSFKLASRSAELTASGAIDAGRRASLALDARALPGARGVGAFAFDAKATGPLDGLALEAEAHARDAKFPGGRLGALDADLHVAPSGAFRDAATRIGLDVEAKASGLALDDPALAEALGATATLAAKGEATPDAVVHIASLSLATQRLAVRFSGEVSRTRVGGTAAVSASDLSAFSQLAGLDLKGALEAKADIAASPNDGAASATVDARINGFASGVAALDGISGGALRLSGGVSRLADGGFAFQRLRLDGAHGSAELDGAATVEQAAVHADIDVPDAAALDARAAGRLKLKADLTGALDHLDAAIEARLDDGRLLDRPAPRLALTAAVRDLSGAAKGEAKLAGLIDASPLSGGLSFARRADGGFDLDRFALSLGSARVEGRLGFAPGLGAEGKLTIAAARLADLAPLALTRLGGALNAAVELAAPGGKQAASIRATSPGLSVGGAAIAGLDVDLSASDVFGARALTGRADAARVTFAGETLSGVKFSAAPAAEGSDLDVSLVARGATVSASGRLAEGAPRFLLSRLVAERGRQRLTLAKPATIAWGGGAVAIDDLALQIGGGRLALAGRAGRALDLKVSAASLPLSALDLVAPGLGLSGSLDAEASVSGAPAAPEGRWRAVVRDLSAPPLRAAGVGALAVKASGALGGGRTSLEATLETTKAGALKLSGFAPLSANGSLEMKASGKLDLAVANPWLAATGRRASGSADVDLSLAGSPARPRATGAVKIRDGAFADETSGFRAERVEAAIDAAGDALTIQRLSAATPNGGTLSASGRVSLDAASGFPGTLTLHGERAELLSNATVATTADFALTLSGPLARAPRASGRIDIRSMDIEIPGRLPSQAVPLADARHIAPGPTARERLALAAVAARGAVASPFQASLDLEVVAENRIFVHGRGVDAELGGELKLAGTSAHPATTGGFLLRRGTLSILGKTLDFTRGAATFHGELIPELDMLAETTAGDVTATVAVTGSAAKPTFAFSSRPELPQDEILSRILFEKPSGGLTPIQAVQLANAVASLSGGPDAFERLRKSLGVNSLDVGSDSSGNAKVGARRAIDNRISVGVTSGARPEDNGVTLDYDLTKRLRLQGGVDAAGGSSVGAGFQWEY